MSESPINLDDLRIDCPACRAPRGAQCRGLELGRVHLGRRVLQLAERRFPRPVPPAPAFTSDGEAFEVALLAVRALVTYGIPLEDVLQAVRAELGARGRG
jgi:hypothetical protein